MADVQLDCKGLKCPMPIVKIAKSAKSLAPGQTMEIIADDPAFKADLEAWVKKMRFSIESYSETDGIHTACIKKP